MANTCQKTCPPNMSKVYLKKHMSNNVSKPRSNNVQTTCQTHNKTHVHNYYSSDWSRAENFLTSNKARASSIASPYNRIQITRNTISLSTTSAATTNTTTTRATSTIIRRTTTKDSDHKHEHKQQKQ